MLTSPGTSIGTDISNTSKFNAYKPIRIDFPVSYLQWFKADDTDVLLLNHKPLTVLKSYLRKTRKKQLHYGEWQLFNVVTSHIAIIEQYWPGKEKLFQQVQHMDIWIPCPAPFDEDCS